MAQPNELDLTQDPRVLAANLKAMSDEAKAPFKEQWLENYKMAAGFLVDITTSTTASLIGGNLTTSRLVATNRFGAPSPLDILRPILSRYLGRHLALMGGWRVTARNGSQEDKDQSEAAEKILGDKWANGDLDIAVMEAFLLSQASSHGYVLIEGDDTLNPPEKFVLEDPATGQPQERIKKTGDVVYLSLSPLQIDIVPGARSVEESPVIAIRQFITETDYVRRWGPLPTDASAKRARFDEGYMDTIQPALTRGMIEVTRLFKRQSAEFPRGEQYLIVGSAAAIPIQNEQKENYMGTYNSGSQEKPKYRYPIVDFRDEPIRMGYWGLGRQSAARPVIKTLNATWSRLAHIASLPLVLAVPQGSDVALDEWADVPFLPIEYNSQTGAPTFLTPGTTENLHKMVEQCMLWLGEIYSQHKSSRGVSSGSRFPAKAVEALQEQDLLADSPAGHMALKAISAVGSKMLGEGLRVWEDEYIVTVLGEEKQSKHYTLKKEALQPGVDVQVIPGDERPKSKSALTKEITELSRYGVIDPKKARALMGSPSREDIYDTNDHHLEMIAKEEQAFERGANVPTFWADNDELHIEHHERRAVERFGISSEQENAARMKHTSAHQEVLKKQADAEFEQQLAAQAKAAAMGAQLTEGQGGEGKKSEAQ